MCTNISTFAKLNFILWVKLISMSWKGDFLYQISIKERHWVKANKNSFSTQIFSLQYAKQALYEGKNRVWYAVFQALYSHTCQKTQTKPLIMAISEIFFPFFFSHFLINLTKNSSRKRS